MPSPPYPRRAVERTLRRGARGGTLARGATPTCASAVASSVHSQGCGCGASASCTGACARRNRSDAWNPGRRLAPQRQALVTRSWPWCLLGAQAGMGAAAASAAAAPSRRAERAAPLVGTRPQPAHCEGMGSTALLVGGARARGSAAGSHRTGARASTAGAGTLLLRRGAARSTAGLAGRGARPSGHRAAARRDLAPLPSAVARIHARSRARRRGGH